MRIQASSNLLLELFWIPVYSIFKNYVCVVSTYIWFTIFSK